jgi:osmotically-inducible protein OsmY
MGERDRNQSYSDRNDSEHHDDSSHRDQGQRNQRDWNVNDDLRRSQGRDHNERYGQSQSQGYGQSHDRSYGQDRNYNQNQSFGQNYNQDRSYGQGNYGQDRNYNQSFGQSYGQDRNHQSYGQNYGQDRHFGARQQDERDFGQRFSGGYDARHYPSYGAYDNRYEREERSLQGQGFDRPYGGASRSYQQEPRLGGGLYGSEQNRFGQQGSLHRDWNARGYPYENESRGAARNFGSYGDNQQRDDDNWGQQLRDGANRVARRVKRAFRGPKGYKRSDERIREDVNDRLAEQHEVDPSEIEVAVSNGDVTLTGSVNSRHEKFLAEEIADDVSGVNDVQNQLRVRREQQQSQGAGARSGETASTIANQNTTEAQRRNARV